MSRHIDHAMILAAGLGTRMRPLTNDRPKPLIKVAGKPLIDYTFDMLRAASMKHFVVNMHYRAEQIETHVADMKDVTLSDEQDELLETGGGLAKAKPFLGDNPFFCSNTDAILMEDEPGLSARRMAALFDPEYMDALLLLCHLDAATGYDGKGDFALEPPMDLGDDARTGRLVWRKDANSHAPLFIYTGLQILSPSLLEGFEAKPFSARLLWEKAMEKGRAFGLVHGGSWMHVGDPKGLEIAEARLASEPQTIS